MFVFAIVFAGFAEVSASTPGNIDSCQTLDTSGTYMLNQSISKT